MKNPSDREVALRNRVIEILDAYEADPEPFAHDPQRAIGWAYTYLEWLQTRRSREASCLLRIKSQSNGHGEDERQPSGADPAQDDDQEEYLDHEECRCLSASLPLRNLFSIWGVKLYCPPYGVALDLLDPAVFRDPDMESGVFAPHDLVSHYPTLKSDRAYIEHVREAVQKAQHMHPDPSAISQVEGRLIGGRMAAQINQLQGYPTDSLRERALEIAHWRHVAACLELLAQAWSSASESKPPATSALPTGAHRLDIARVCTLVKRIREVEQTHQKKGAPLPVGFVSWQKERNQLVDLFLDEVSLVVCAVLHENPLAQLQEPTIDDLRTGRALEIARILREAVEADAVAVEAARLRRLSEQDSRDLSNTIAAAPAGTDGEVSTRTALPPIDDDSPSPRPIQQGDRQHKPVFHWRDRGDGTIEYGDSVDGIIGTLKEGNAPWAAWSVLRENEGTHLSWERFAELLDLVLSSYDAKKAGEAHRNAEQIAALGGRKGDPGVQFKQPSRGKRGSGEECDANTLRQRLQAHLRHGASGTLAQGLRRHWLATSAQGITFCHEADREKPAIR